MNIEHKKTEKLISALYLLTSFFSDLEPMKWRLRELGSKLLSVKESRSLVQEIMSLLTVSKNAGLISDMNHEIIHREFGNLLPKTESLGEIFKKIETHEEPVFVAKEVPNRSEEKSVTNYLPRPSELHVFKDRPVREVVKSESLKDGAVALKKSGRQYAILNLLKKKPEIMIKDITPHIEGVSEKTIQRELLSLVKDGILKKEGEKRWSRYSLV